MASVATPSEPDRAAVETWLEGVRNELRRVAAEIEPLLAEQVRLRDREALLLKLLQSMSGDTSNPSPGVESVPDAPVVQPLEGSVLDYVRGCVLEILREKGGGPMHINDIHSRFLAKGFRVPGAGRPANLTAHLGRCPGITSPSRGFYAIGDPTPSPTKRRRRKRR